MKVTVNNNKGIDWDKPQLLISEEERIVYSIGSHDEKTFTGFLVAGIDSPDYNNSWGKRYFTLYKGSITLEND
jgi:hypothetical protein